MQLLLQLLTDANLQCNHTHLYCLTKLTTGNGDARTGFTIDPPTSYALYANHAQLGCKWEVHDTDAVPCVKGTWKVSYGNLHNLQSRMQLTSNSLAVFIVCMEAFASSVPACLPSTRG